MSRQDKSDKENPFKTNVFTYFYTRFGLGVSDPQWMEYRLRLFQAVTLPSVRAHLNKHTKWLIYIDEKMHPRAKEWLRTISDHPSIQLIPVVTMAQIPYKLANMLAGMGTVRLIRIDDDDAISTDFLEAIPLSAGVHTLPNAYEVDLMQRTMRPIQRPFLSLNTVYQGPAEHAEVYARMGHHRIERWATNNGMTVNHVKTQSPVCIYSRHKQSDSNYPTVHRQIAEDKYATPFNLPTRARFGIDESLFQQWREFASAAPKTPSGSVWSKSQELNNEAARLWHRLYEINTEIREVTRDLFD